MPRLPQPQPPGLAALIGPGPDRFDEGDRAPGPSPIVNQRISTPPGPERGPGRIGRRQRRVCCCIETKTS